MSFLDGKMHVAICFKLKPTNSKHMEGPIPKKPRLKDANVKKKKKVVIN